MDPDPWLLQALLYLRERSGRSVDMQGLPAAMEGCWPGPGHVRQATVHGVDVSEEACTAT